MPSYLHPGVYVEEIPSGVKPIEGVKTSTAAFIGRINRGPIYSNPLALTPINKWDQYVETHGGIRETYDERGLGDAMGLSVFAFFQNGGREAYVVRVAKNAAKATASLSAATSSPPSPNLLEFEAANEGVWGNTLHIRLSYSEEASPPSNLLALEVGFLDRRGDFVAQESFRDLNLHPKDRHYIKGRVKSALITVTAVADNEPAAAVMEALHALQGSSPPSAELPLIRLDGGNDGVDPDLSHFQEVFDGFLKIRDIRVICLPGQLVAPPGDPATDKMRGIIDAAIGHCEAVKSRMVVVDPVPGEELRSAAQVTAFELPTSTYSALYYPWPRVANPFYDAERNPNVLPTLLVPPSAFAAGMWGKIDEKRGVWKAPAGLETQLLGVQGLQYVVEDAEQDTLNPLGVNALRNVLSFGKVIWGARTLSTQADPEWRYVPVRRTAIYIEQSIYGGIQWAVFEGNDHRLWSSLRANIDAFMESLFRAGAFQGAKKSDAYFVRCGLGDTMTQNDIDAGRVIAIVGFAPLKPAEFVIVRIQQKVNQQ